MTSAARLWCATPALAIEIEILRFGGWDFTRRMTGGSGAPPKAR